MESRKPAASELSGHIGGNENLFVDRETQVDDPQRLESLLVVGHVHQRAQTDRLFQRGVHLPSGIVCSNVRTVRRQQGLSGWNGRGGL